MSDERAEALAEALWDYREQRDPSGERTGVEAGDHSRDPVFWKEAVAEDRWPGSRCEQLEEARIVLEMLAPASPPTPDDDLLERAVDAYHAEYHRHWRDGGDAQDHDEAHRCGLEAVLVLVGALSPSCVRQHDAEGRPLCFTCGRTQSEHEGGVECAASSPDNVGGLDGVGAERARAVALSAPTAEPGWCDKCGRLSMSGLGGTCQQWAAGDPPTCGGRLELFPPAGPKEPAGNLDPGPVDASSVGRAVFARMHDTLRAVLAVVSLDEPYPWKPGGALMQQIRGDLTAYEALGLDAARHYDPITGRRREENA